MRRHGLSARRRETAAAKAAEQMIDGSMWAARVHREARRGAVVVAGQKGEVLQVLSVNLSGYGVNTGTTDFHVRADILARTGPRWVQDDLKKSPGEAPCSVHGHVARDRRPSDTPGPKAGQI